MGIFDKPKNEFNKALEHFRRAKAVAPESPIFLQELNSAIILLQAGIKNYKGASDELVLLSNIYYTMAIIGFSIESYKIYYFLSVATIYHWKTGRGYTKNLQQGNQVFEMVKSSFNKFFPNMTSQVEIEKSIESIHDRFYEVALSQSIYNSNIFS